MSMSFPMVHSITNTSPNTVLNGRSSYGITVTRNEKRPNLFTHDYDVVYGPIMNDTIGFQMREYRKRNISLQEFLEGIKYSRGETYQYAFCTQRAIKYLHRL